MKEFNELYMVGTGCNGNDVTGKPDREIQCYSASRKTMKDEIRLFLECYRKCSDYQAEQATSFFFFGGGDIFPSSYTFVYEDAQCDTQ